jgi:hypothetical protein
MKQSVAICILVACSTVVIVVALVAPTILSDAGNSFLKGFVNHELLSILGVILAISLGTAAQLHLAFNKIEEDYRAPGALSKPRHSVHTSAFWLVGLFVGAIFLVAVKPLLAKAPWSEALFNGGALIILGMFVMSLVDLLRTAFAVEAKVDDDTKKDN